MMISWRCQPEECLSGLGDGKPGGYYVIADDGTETGPFAECPPSPEEVAARAAARAAAFHIQELLAQEPRP